MKNALTTIVDNGSGPRQPPSRGIDRETSEGFRRLIHQASGIFLGDDKDALLATRMLRRMRTLGIPDYGAYLDYVKGDPRGTELAELIDAISTNVTSFFRESRHLELFEEMSARWIAEGQRRFRFWCAASSSGEEPYSMAMTFLEAAGERSPDMRILATDISRKVLTMASRAEYESSKLRDVSPQRKNEFFDYLPDGDQYRVCDRVRSKVLFKRLNLVRFPYPMQGPLDVIFCRNVLIYFDDATRMSIVREMHRLLKPGGLLFLGYSEAMAGLGAMFDSVEPCVYAKREARSA